SQLDLYVVFSIPVDQYMRNRPLPIVYCGIRDVMKRRQVLTATAVATAATLGTAATASAAPGHGEHTPPGLAKKDTLAWAAGGAIEIGSAVAGGGHHTEQDSPTPTPEEPYRATPRRA